MVTGQRGVGISSMSSCGGGCGGCGDEVSEQAAGGNQILYWIWILYSGLTLSVMGRH